MKKIFILLFTAVLLYFYSAAQSGDLIKYIPANASIVVDIDCGSLSQKVSRQDLVELKFFDSLVKKAKAESKEKFSDMSESGIDYHDHMYMTITMSEKDSIASVIIYGKVSEEAKLSKLLEKPDDKNVIRKTAGPNKMMMQENFLFGWNSSMFVLYVKKPFNKKTTTAKKLTATEKKKELAALEKICVELMTPKTQSILSNKSFETIAQGKGDFKIWIDNNSMPKTFKGNGPMAAFKMNNLLKADHKAIIVNFDKGSIVSNTYTYYNENSLALAQNLYAEKVNADLIRKIPAGNILGLYAMSFKPGGIKDFLENAGIMKQFENTDNGADKGKAETAAFLNNLKGDLVMAFGLPEQIQEDNSETKNPFSNFNIYIAATVNDEAKMSKFIDSLKALTKKRKEEFDSLKEDQYTKKSEFFKDLRSSVVVENGAVFFTAGNLAASSLTSTDNYNDLIQQYGQRPIMMVFDMKTLMSMMVGMINKTRHYSEQDSAMFSMFQVFDKMITSGGKFENDAMVSTLEVKFSNPEESSLKQMLKMFDLAMSAFSKLPVKTTVKDIEVKEN